MPDQRYLRCYFGCEKKGILHHFPKPTYPSKDRFDLWKKVLRQETQIRSEQYVYDQLRLCDQHFEPCYRLPNGRLTRNAIPTLNIALHESPSLEYDAPANLGPGESSIYSQSLLSNTPSNILEQPGVPCASGHTITKQISNERKIKKLQAKLKNMCDRYKTQKQKFKCAQKLSQSKAFLRVIEKLPEPVQVFSRLQLKFKKKPRGRRYNIEEKILALSIFKQSPKAYNLLKKIFVLPSKRSLQKLLALIPLEPGVNQLIFENMKKSVDRLPKDKKLCTLIFDEVAIEPGLYFNKGRIVGFEDSGYESTMQIADHALVFMLKSIKGKYKQTICFTFCKSCTKKDVLKNLIKRIVKAVQKTGLQIIATICDQSSTNVRVIKTLQEETKAKYLRNSQEYTSSAMEIEEMKIFPLFDTPHLLKGVRNNLLKKEATFYENGIHKIAKWEHLIMLFNEDIGQDEIRLVNKLTEAHIIEKKIPKMKVKHAAQVFSQRVSSAMRFSARHNILPAECEDTAQFLLMFDKLFNSFNGHSYSDSAKPFKGCLKNNSPHVGFWNEVLPILKTMKFKTICKNRDGTEKVKYEKVPSVSNWAKNIETFKEMWEYLKREHKISNVITRNFNQDPLENFFCGIRSNGIRNINPTCAQFINAYKTLVVNNLSSPHSISANCEEDHNQCLQSLKYLVNCKADCVPQDKDIFVIDPLLQNLNRTACGEDSRSIIHLESKRYVAGYIINKCQKKIFKNCKECKNDFINQERDPATYTYFRDYTKKSLIYVKQEFIDLTNKIYEIIILCLRNSPQERKLKENIMYFIDIDVNFNMITCATHRAILIKFIVNIAINIIVHSWCKNVNQILKGKLSKFDPEDLVKEQARVYYEKGCKIKKK